MSTVLELHTGVDWLGRALLDQGHDLIELVPHELVDQRCALGRGPVYGIGHWSDRTALKQLAVVLPRVDHVACIDEGAIGAAGYLRHLLHLPGLSVADAEACTSKDSGKRRLRRARITVAHHRVVERGEQVAAAAAALGWPVVVKADLGAGASNTYLVNGPADLEAMLTAGVFDRPVPDPTGRFRAAGFNRSLNDGGRIVVEAYVRGREHFCDLLRHSGRTLLAAPGRYNRNILESLGTHQWDTLLPLDSKDAHDMIELAEKTADALGITTGAVHVEMFATANGWVVGEAGARPGGGGIRQLYALQHGADIEHAMAMLAVGQRPDLAPDARFPVLTNLLLAAGPGTVASVATADELRTMPGVVDVDLHLRTGEPVPGSFGSLSGAGRIVIASHDLDQVDADVDWVLSGLHLSVQDGRPAMADAAAA